MSVTSPPPCAPFAPPALPGLFATMGALTPAWRALRTLPHHEHPLGSIQVSLLNVPGLLTPPSPTTPQSPYIALSRYPSARMVSPSLGFSSSFFSGSRFCPSLASSPVLFGRIEFVILRMSLSPPAAPHRASRRRSCSRLQAGERIPEGDLHPSVQSYYLCTLTGARARASRPHFSRRCGQYARVPRSAS